MNLEFIRTSLDGAQNSDGAVVEGFGRELMHYVRGGFDLKFEVFVKKGRATVYQPAFLPSPLPADMTSAEIFDEIRAGVAAATGAVVEWKA